MGVCLRKIQVLIIYKMKMQFLCKSFSQCTLPTAIQATYNNPHSHKFLQQSLNSFININSIPYTTLHFHNQKYGAVSHPAYIYAYTNSLRTISSAALLTLFISPIHFICSTAFNSSVIPAPTFIRSISNSTLAWHSSSISCKYSFNLPSNNSRRYSLL